MMNLRQIQDIAGHRNVPPWVIKLVQDCIEHDRMYEREKQQEAVAYGYFDADGKFMDALDHQYGAYQTPLCTIQPTAAHKPNENCECANCLNYYTDVAQAAALAAKQMRDTAVKAIILLWETSDELSLHQLTDAIAALPILGEEK